MSKPSIKYKLSALALQLMTERSLDFRPSRGTLGSAGIDLRACIVEPVAIGAGETAKVMTGVHLFLGNDLTGMSDGMLGLGGFYLPRSSANGLILQNTVGTLDQDFQGESFVKLRNVSGEAITVEPGEKLVQLIPFVTCFHPLEAVESFESPTDRGEGGDGSTGRF